MDPTRREFLAAASMMVVGPSAGKAGAEERGEIGAVREGGVVVNDVHAGLSRAVVREVVWPTTTDEFAEAMRAPASVCGGRYCSGGQPFLRGERLIDLERFGRVLAVDPERGLVTAQAGTRWPTLIAYLNEHAPAWAIRQKQSGANAVSLAGTVSVNAHGRCLGAPPIVDDIEALDLIDADGGLRRCDRSTDSRRFGRVVGGYGMFGTIATVTLRLVPRVKLIRRVAYVPAEEAVAALDRKAADGVAYGDFHLNVDARADDFLAAGLMMTYEPVDPATPISPPVSDPGSFLNLATLAHVDKARAFAEYRDELLREGPFVDWSDHWQSAEYVPGYHAAIDEALGAKVRGSEVLSEFYVPRERLTGYLSEMARVLREREADPIYGNVRLIEPDTETALPWATGRMACVVLNVHTDHDAAGLRHTRDVFRDLLDAAIVRGGTYYLAYHRFARRDQVLACYPQLPALLAAADGPCSSDWRRAYVAEFAAESSR